jgi:hypothetical protein
MPNVLHQVWHLIQGPDYILASPFQSKHLQAVLLNDTQQVTILHDLQMLQPKKKPDKQKMIWLKLVTMNRNAKKCHAYLCS